MNEGFVLVAGAIAVAFTAQTLAGFGGVVVALTLGALVWPIPELLPLLVPLSFLNTCVLAMRERRHVAWRLLLTRILPLMILGGSAGFVLLRSASGPWLERAFGALVVGVGLRELLARAPQAAAQPELEPSPVEAVAPLVALAGAGGAESERSLGGPTPEASLAGAAPSPAPAQGGWLMVAGLMAAGVVHGIYASGGPLLVASLSSLGLGKGVFRATLAMVFFFLGTVLCSLYLATGMIRAEHAPAIGLLIPVLVGAYLFGDWAHHRVDERAFRRVVALLLVLAGGALVFKGGAGS